MLVPVYNHPEAIVAMSQVPDNLPTPPISMNIPRGKAGRWSSVWKNLLVALEDSKAEYYSGESKQDSDEEGGYPTEEKLPSNDEK